MSVDLPEPDGPMIAVKAPLANATLTPRRAWTAASPEPYTLVTSVATTAGGALTTVLVTDDSLIIWRNVINARDGREPVPSAARPAFGRSSR